MVPCLTCGLCLFHPQGTSIFSDPFQRLVQNPFRLLGSRESILELAIFLLTLSDYPGCVLLGAGLGRWRCVGGEGTLCNCCISRTINDVDVSIAFCQHRLNLEVSSHIVRGSSFSKM